MPPTATPAYITTIRPDRTIILPEEMAVGATVAVVILPSSLEAESLDRNNRFEATLNAINKAANIGNAPSISDEQLDQLIKEAVKSSTA